MILNGSEILAEVLLEHGVDTVFGFPGGGVLYIYDALYKYSDRIRHIMTAHEQGAAHAADGYARATGKTGVVIATSGPGATNLVTGIATAYMDSVPMVAITGNVPTGLIGRDSFQEVYIAGITMTITKHNFVVRNVEDLADTVRKAFRIANEGRKGPVLIDIPKDISAAKTEYISKMPIPPEPVKTSGEEYIKKIAGLINEARKPFIIFGGGVRLSDAGNELRELIFRAGIPSAYTMMAAGVLGYREKYNLGLAGMHGCLSVNRAMDEADLLLAVGTRFSDRVALNMSKFAKKAKIVHIDIDPSEINKNITVDYYAIGDVRDVLKRLLVYVENSSHPEWEKQIDEWKKSDYTPCDRDDALTPHGVINSVCSAVGEDAIFTTDVGQHQMWAAQFIHHLKTRSFLTSGGLGTMGYGYGAAIGAQVAFPERRVVHITSDGSFHMNLNEGCTAASYNLPIITVIMDNEVLGMVYQWQTVFYGKRYSSSEPERKTDYVKIAEGFGIKGYFCKTPDELEKALSEAVKLREPAWIVCKIDRSERVLPMIPPGQTVNETILF